MTSKLHLTGKGNGNPSQYSCLANPMDRGAWWATVHKVAKSWTRLSVHMHTQTQITLRSLAFQHCLSVVGILTLTKIICGGKLTVSDISDDIFTYCTPFLFQIPGAPDDEAVRIFLEFERVESAIKGTLYS